MIGSKPLPPAQRRNSSSTSFQSAVGAMRSTSPSPARPSSTLPEIAQRGEELVSLIRSELHKSDLSRVNCLPFSRGEVPSFRVAYGVDKDYVIRSSRIQGPGRVQTSTRRRPPLFSPEAVYTLTNCWEAPRESELRDN